ncbi:hypothetical protein KC878_04265 [Candidatus Saccharibacteria bacterium]|nr:hypothetical protein [Candidatus Saccharibacteria bacterium]MCB9821466.1 hypothetical protein [Candidatus Nomurabacteria bacterium]
MIDLEFRGDTHQRRTPGSQLRLAYHLAKAVSESLRPPISEPTLKQELTNFVVRISQKYDFESTNGATADTPVI